MIKFRGMSFLEWCGLLAVVIIVALLASEAGATPPNKYAPPSKVVINKNTIDKSIEQRQEQNNFQSQLQDVDVSTGDVNVDAGSTFNREREAHSAPAISIFPSGNCGQGWSAGIGLPGGNAGFGKTSIDPGCEAREVARLFYQMGEREKAIMLLCAQPAAQSLADCAPHQDYNADMFSLKAQHEMLLKDNGDLERVKRDLEKQIESMGEELKERDRRIFEAGVKK